MERLIRELLERFKREEITLEEVIERLRVLPFEDIREVLIDHHRSLRKGFPEVIFGQGKTSEQISKAIETLLKAGENVLVTRLSPKKAERILERFPQGQYHPMPRLLTIRSYEPPKRGRGYILVVSAGTSDLPVAEEAALTAEAMGHEVRRLYDVGVSGIHRLLYHLELLRGANVLVVVAGMEGALPSVVGGLVSRPVIAVPTSIGYGASFKGVSALLGMLTSCTSNVVVVNIDNGFSAGVVASLINE